MCHGENSSLFKVTYVRDMDEFLATTLVISPINRAQRTRYCKLGRGEA